MDGQASAIGVKDGVAGGSRWPSSAKLLQRTEVGSRQQHGELQQAVHYASSVEVCHQGNSRVSRDGPLVSLRGLLGRILHVWVTPWLIRKFVSGVTGQNSLRGIGGS